MQYAESPVLPSSTRITYSTIVQLCSVLVQILCVQLTRKEVRRIMVAKLRGGTGELRVGTGRVKRGEMGHHSRLQF